MDWSGWAVFGLLATTALTAALILAQFGGLTRMDLPMMLGTLFVDDPDRARALGFFVHLGIGQVFAFFYAAVFALVGQASWQLGAGLGLLHALVALSVLVPIVLPGVHPRMATTRSGPSTGVALEPPGPLGLNYGRQTLAVALVAHAVYGVALGGLLGPG
jgi:hypothetical protein